MMSRRFLLSAAPALLIAKPALASAVCSLEAPPAIHRAPAGISEGFAMLTLAGETVMVDTHDYILAPGDRALTVDPWGGRVFIGRPRNYRTRFEPMRDNARSASIDGIEGLVTIIGRVV